MIKEKCEFYDQTNPVQDIIQQEIVEQKPFELPSDFCLKEIVSSKPTPPPKPQRTKLEHNDETISGSSDIASEQEYEKTFAEKKDFFEQLSNGCKPKGKVANRIEQINRYGLNSNIESKHKTIDIEEVQQVCEHGKHER